VSGLVGALLGGLIYAIFPPDFRARATVVVDFNMEQAWPVDSDRELFYYLEREVRKLKEVAWSDDVLAEVAVDVKEITIDELRSGVLELSEPADGGWHFYANDATPARAEQLVSVWAGTFTGQILKGIENAVALDAARKALESNPSDETLLERISKLESTSLGITPELQISLVQGENLKPNRRIPLGNYVFVGAVSFMVFSALATLFFGKTGRV